MTKTKKAIKIVLLLVILIMSVNSVVQASSNVAIDKDRTANLTIICYENINGNKENTPYYGAEFTIYQISSEIENVEDAEKFVKDNKIEGYSLITDNEGKAEFVYLEQGKYFVEQSKAPTNATSKVESFLIDLPRTNEDGDGWEYDVTVYPKNITAYGKVTINVPKDNENREIPNFWKLKILDENEEWVDYDTILYSADENGQIIVEDLKAGKYKIYEFESNYINDGYIVNSDDCGQFSITLDGLEKEITIEKEKVEVEKYVSLGNENYGKNTGVFKEENISWKTTANIPTIISKMSKYTILEYIESNLILDEKSIKAYGDNENNEISKDCYKLNIKDGEIEIEFIPNKIKEYKDIIVTYNTQVSKNMENGKSSTQARVCYTDNIDYSGNSISEYLTSFSKAEIYTGGIQILKTDTNGEKLEGASFKIATTRENAENGEFVKNSKGDDLVSTSDKNGNVKFDGLKYGNENEEAEEAESSYWVVETKAPDGYRLLDKSKEVKVNYNSATEENKKVKIQNRKEYELPMTGGKFPIISMCLGTTLIIISIIGIKKKNKKEKVTEIEKEN